MFEAWPRHRRVLVGGGTLGLSLALVAAALVVGQVTTASAQAPKYRIAFLSQGFPNPHSKAEADGAKARAKQVGASVQVFDGAFDAVKQVNQFEDALTSKKYDAFLLNCLDCSAIIPVLKKAVAQKKKVVTIASPVAGSNRVGYYPGTVAHVNTTPVIQGGIMASEVLRALPGGGTMALIEGVAGQTGNEDFKKGFMAVMSKQSKVKIVADQYADWDPNKALTVLQAILQANPDIDLLHTWADEMTVGPAQYLASQNKICKFPAKTCASGQIKLIGHGITKAGLAQLRAGNYVSAWANLPYQHGYIGVDYLVKALQGKKVPKANSAHPSPPCPKRGECIFTKATIPAKAAKFGIGY
jgi:ribose transport system substrate-binding protein